MPTEAELRDTQGQLQDLRNQAAEFKRKIDGIRINTDKGFSALVKGNWTDFFGGNHLVRIEGDLQKVQVGASDSFYLGPKFNAASGGLFSLYGPFELKVVKGNNMDSIYGLKKEVVYGAKWDELLGSRYEYQSSPTRYIGASKELKKEDDQMEQSQGIVEKFVRWTQKISVLKTNCRDLNQEYKVFKRRVKKLERNYKKIHAKAATINKTLKKETAEVKNCRIEAKGAVNIKGATIYMSGGDRAAELDLEGNLSKGGTFISCAGGAVTFKASEYTSF